MDDELKLLKLPYLSYCKHFINRVDGFSKSRLSGLSYYLVIGEFFFKTLIYLIFFQSCKNSLFE